MIKLRKHIAFLIFEIFLFPILFQSLHIIRHHSPDYKCEHNNCFQKIANTYFNSNGQNLSENEKTCLIREYQFSINDLPKISFFYAVISVFTYAYIEATIEQYYKQVFSDITPRAPPVYRVESL